MTAKKIKSNTGRNACATLALVVLLFSIRSKGNTADDDPAASPPPPALTAEEVRMVVKQAASSVTGPMAVAVTDRLGNILAVYDKPDTPPTSTSNFSMQADPNEVAVALARTAAFFSNSQAPLSSRTVRYISGIHFPPGIMFTGNAALYGIENTNRGCGFSPNDDDFAPGKAVPPARLIDGTKPGLGILTGKADLNDSNPDAVNPGGVPLFKNGVLVGGVGVSGVDFNVAEFAACSGAKFMLKDGTICGAAPAPPGVVIIDGIALPFVNQTSLPAGSAPGTAKDDDFKDDKFATIRIKDKPEKIFSPIDSPGPAPEGDLIVPRDGPVGGLSSDEVRRIVDNTVATGKRTRAVIRLPLGTRASFVIAVADLDGRLLALNRMPDATIFSIDVAVAKARNVIFFSGPNRRTDDLPGVPLGTAVTNRTISFGAQPFFPPGIDYSTPGPFFNLYKLDTMNPCTQGSQKTDGNQNGIVFFPGALPLYKNGMLVGGLGVSGDGVEQDDFATAGGAVGFEAPSAMRADRVFDQGVRLPYIKFPRNPVD